jgi:sortase A
VAGAVGVIGEMSITGGVLVLLFVVYTLWGTGVATAEAQDRLRDDLEEVLAPRTDATDEPPSDPDDLDDGDALGLMRIPRFGHWEWAIVQGTDPGDLKTAPGHYVHSANPGELGNFAVAGHRMGHGSPFKDFPNLRVGDLVEVTTAEGVFVYELDDAPDGDPDGNKIEITDVWVVDPVPGSPSDKDPTERRITLTTCWPLFGAEARMYATGVLVSGPEL